MIRKSILSLSFILLIGSGATSQDTLNIIERAMKDEMDRSMKELRSEKFSAPFFIRYRIDNQQSIMASATLGALQNSANTSSRSKDIRVMVGDYEFNDESLDDDGSGVENTPSGYSDFSVPEGDDYYGIRRSLWITTDAIYKVAGQIYKNMINKLEQDGKTYEDIDHRRFARSPRVEYTEPIKTISFNLNELEEYVRRSSALFYDYDDLLVSGVRANISTNTEYFLNSEGTRYRTSTYYGNIIFTVSMLTDDGSLVYETYNHDLNEGDALPTVKEDREIVKELMGRLSMKDSSDAFEDNYYGPVLFTGKTVSNLLSRHLVTNLYASNELKNDEYNYGGYNRGSQSFDNRIGQRVVSKELSVTLHPTLKEWNGMKLKGSYEIDNEGVIPPDTLILIENGVLKNLMSTRTLTREDQVATGTGSGPGVVHITTSESRSPKALREQLIELAKKYDQKYALIVKDNQDEYGGLYNLDVYKVDVDTGNEELFSGANISTIGVNNLKRILGISSQMIVNNQGYTSYIAPNALLLEDIEVSGSYDQQLKLEKPLVESPLTLKK